ncbi:hypothetical protein GCM10010207_62880 [Streptomyces atratus]|nr:hypothetical protein GCM10010207_62880 [Streptomyces atratus]
MLPSCQPARTRRLPRADPAAPPSGGRPGTGRDRAKAGEIGATAAAEGISVLELIDEQATLEQACLDLTSDAMETSPAARHSICPTGQDSWCSTRAQKAVLDRVERTHGGSDVGIGGTTRRLVGDPAKGRIARCHVLKDGARRLKAPQSP